MLWLDVKYANLLSIHLDRYSLKQNNPFLSNFRCPICGDSKTNKSKARGYLYQNKDNLTYKCHNCSASKSFSFFLKDINPHLFDQYKLEKFKESPKKSFENKNNDFEFSTPKFHQENILDEYYTKVSELDHDHPCYIYCAKREIPRKHYSKLYYIDDFSPVEKHFELKMKGKVENRLGIPFFDKYKNLSGVTCRAIDENPFRYYTAKFSPFPLLYGIDRVNEDETIYVVEGPLDSLFISNAIAVGSSDLTRIEKQYTPNQCVLIYDNQPRNKEIRQEMIKAWEKDFPVVVWPKKINEKDINEMTMNGHDVESLIQENTYTGTSLFLEISRWSKCE